MSQTIEQKAIENKDEFHRGYQYWAERSFITFVRGLIIPSAHGPVRFDSEVMAPFQLEFFEAIAPSLQAVRDGTMPPARRFWLERTKKASKDSDMAICLLWLMAFTSRPLLCQVCASNSEQAGIIEDRANSLIHYNPWLGQYVDIVQRRIRSRQNPRKIRTRIEATGTPGAAQGPTPDVLVLNELVHVDRWPVMEAHMHNADGVPQGIVVIATNAGIKGSRAEVWRKNALANKNKWSTFVWHEVAPWVDLDDVADAKRRDPVGSEYNRLWGGVWVSGKGDAVGESDIDKCFRARGPHPEPLAGWRYVAGLDLGISHDHAGVVSVGVKESEQRIAVADLRAYIPEIPNDKGVKEVDSDAVEQCVLDWWKLYGVEWFGYDPAAGGSFMAQRLRKKGVPMREMTFSSPTNSTSMAKAFVTLVKDGKLECYEDAEGRLRRDFGKFQIEHKPPSRYRLMAVSDEFGHADVGTALVICLPRAVEMLGGWSGFLPDDELAFGDEDDLTEQEIEDLPDEFRDMFDVEEEFARPKRVLDF